MDCTQACCRKKHSPRSEEQQRLLHNRLNRMIGQLNGIKTMIDENRYCGDILTQVAAVENALTAFGYVVLEEHMRTCMVEELHKGNLDIVDEAVGLIRKLK